MRGSRYLLAEGLPSAFPSPILLPAMIRITLLKVILAAVVVAAQPSQSRGALYSEYSHLSRYLSSGIVISYPQP
jgi:hypothetical protein